MDSMYARIPNYPTGEIPLWIQMKLSNWSNFVMNPNACGNSKLFNWSNFVMNPNEIVHSSKFIVDWNFHNSRAWVCNERVSRSCSARFLVS
jgi:hypothetical protein